MSTYTMPMTFSQSSLPASDVKLYSSSSLCVHRGALQGGGRGVVMDGLLDVLSFVTGALKDIKYTSHTLNMRLWFRTRALL